MTATDFTALFGYAYFAVFVCSVTLILQIGLVAFL